MSVSLFAPVNSINTRVKIYREYRLDLGYKSILGGGSLITADL